MTTLTYQEQLESVQAAIARIEEGGQSYSLSTNTGSRQVTRANLSELYRREKELRGLVARQERGGMRVFGGTPVNNG